MKKYAILSLRLPPELHRQIADVASARYPRTSINAEIVERLWRSFNPDYQTAETDDLEDLRRRLVEVERYLFGSKEDES